VSVISSWTERLDARQKPLRPPKTHRQKFLGMPCSNEPDYPDRAAFIRFTQNVKVRTRTITTRSVKWALRMNGASCSTSSTLWTGYRPGRARPLHAVFRAVQDLLAAAGPRRHFSVDDGRQRIRGQHRLTTKRPDLTRPTGSRTPIFPIGLRRDSSTNICSALRFRQPVAVPIHGRARN